MLALPTSAAPLENTVIGDRTVKKRNDINSERFEVNKGSSSFLGGAF